MGMWFRKERAPDGDAQAVTDSIKSLKTLTCRDGRVSVDPREILEWPGYQEARRSAAALVRQPWSQHSRSQAPSDWRSFDEIGVEAWVTEAISVMLKARASGECFFGAIEQLKHLRAEGLRHE